MRHNSAKCLIPDFLMIQMQKGFMSRTLSKLIILAGFLGLTGCAGQNTSVNSPTDVNEYPSVTLISWSDFHSSIYEYAKSDTEVMGGLPVFMAAVENAKSDGLNLLIDGGDMFQGAMPFNEAKGMGMVEVMNSLGLDVATFGNHEFDYGKGSKYADSERGALQEVVEASHFPWATSNVVATADNTVDAWPYPNNPPYVIIEKGPYKIAVIGVLATETPIATTAAHVAGLEFKSPAETLKTIIPEVVEKHPDMIIVDAHITGLPTVPYEDGAYLTDVTFDNEIGEILALPEEILSQIDLLLTGHSHSSFIALEHGLPVVQSLSAGREITTMTLEGDKNGLHVVPVSIKKHVLTHKPLDVACGQERAALEPIDVGGVMLTPSQAGVDILNKYESQMEQNRCAVVGCLDELIKHNYEGECALGNLVTNALISHYPEADVAFQNAGGLRIDMAAGPIYLESLNALMPFDNYAHLVELTGADVIRALKIASTLKHGTTQVAGIQYKVEPNCKNPEDINGDGQIVDWENNCLCEGVLIKGNPIDPAATYKVVMSDFILNGGDDHAGCFNSAKILDKGPVIKSIMLQYVQSQQACFNTSQLVNSESPRISLGSCNGKFTK